MLKFFLAKFLILIAFVGMAQRGGGLSEMSPLEIKQKKFEDSMQKLRDDFARDFDTKEYFQKWRDIKLKKDSLQLNATLEYFREIESVADTMTQLTIQSSALSIFPSTIRNFKNLKTLTLRRCQSVHLEALFEQIKDLPSLERLEIIHSDKTKLPDNIGLLQKLKYLDLQGNKLTNLPDGLANIKTLESINLHNNILLDVDGVFPVLAKLPLLKSVKMSGCKVYSLGDHLAKMQQIEELDVNLNSIETLPLGLENMKQLRKLNLSRNSKLQTMQIFSALASIPNLEVLDLSDGNISELNAGIGALSLIKKLILTNNPLKKIPSEIGNLVQLEELYLGAGVMQKDKIPLSELPAQLSKCSKLKVLDARLCQISQLPKEFSLLENLTYLDLSWNQLSQFPEMLKTISTLQFLDLSYNKINDLPNDFGLMALSLETLRIEANFYAPYKEKITKIPASLVRCKKLKRLSLKDQLYESLPDRFWYDLTQMEDLNLMGALLSEIPDAIENMPNLRELNVKSNELKSISPSIAKLSNLETLNVSYNPSIPIAEFFQIIRTMKSLKTVDLSYNDIKRELLEPIAAEMKQTKFIKLETKDSPAYERPKR